MRSTVALIAALSTLPACGSITEMEIGPPDIGPIAVDALLPMPSGSGNIELLTAGESAYLRQRLGDKRGAIVRIEVQLMQRAYTDVATGTAINPQRTILYVDDNVLDDHRETLSDGTRDRLLNDVAAAREVVLPVALHLDDPTTAPAIYTSVVAQPYLIVQLLDAL